MNKIKLNKITPYLDKAFKTMAFRISQSPTGRFLDEQKVYKKISSLYMRGGQSAVEEYCKPHIVKKITDTIINNHLKAI